MVMVVVLVVVTIRLVGWWVGGWPSAHVPVMMIVVLFMWWINVCVYDRGSFNGCVVGGDCHLFVLVW